MEGGGTQKELIKRFARIQHPVIGLSTSEKTVAGINSFNSIETLTIMHTSKKSAVIKQTFLIYPHVVFAVMRNNPSSKAFTLFPSLIRHNSDKAMNMII